jgi:hypothetical protein
VVTVTGMVARIAGENSEVFWAPAATLVAVAVMKRSPAGKATVAVTVNGCGVVVTVTVCVPRYVCPSASALGFA